MANTLDTGRDTYCVESLQPGRMATGLELFAQRLYHRLSTPAGMLRGGEEEADFCEDLSNFVGSTDQRAIGPLLPVRAENVLRRDPGVVDVTVAATRTVSGGEVSWELVIDVVSELGPLTLLVGVSGVSVDLLGVR